MNMKIFEKVEYSDGSPNDRGTVVGYISALSLKEAKKILNVNHGFLQVHEISMGLYYERKEIAKRNFLKFKL